MQCRRACLAVPIKREQAKRKRMLVVGVVKFCINFQDSVSFSYIKNSRYSRKRHDFLAELYSTRKGQDPSVPFGKVEVLPCNSTC